MYVRADYLLWSTKGRSVPTLVTTGDPTSTAIPAGVINENGSLPGNTQILFGNGLINGQGRSGGRIVLGTYLSPCWTLEGDYYALTDQTTAFRGVSTGNTFLGIPFFDESNNGLPAIFTVAPGAGGPAGASASMRSPAFKARVSASSATSAAGKGAAPPGGTAAPLMLPNDSTCCWDIASTGWTTH